jgi:hypothetical protein
LAKKAETDEARTPRLTCLPGARRAGAKHTLSLFAITIRSNAGKRIKDRTVWNR